MTNLQAEELNLVFPWGGDEGGGGEDFVEVCVPSCSFQKQAGLHPLEM